MVLTRRWLPQNVQSISNGSLIWSIDFFFLTCCIVKQSYINTNTDALHRKYAWKSRFFSHQFVEIETYFVFKQEKFVENTYDLQTTVKFEFYIRIGFNFKLAKINVVWRIWPHAYFIRLLSTNKNRIFLRFKHKIQNLITEPKQIENMEKND